MFSLCLAVCWLVSSGSGGHHQLLAGLLVGRLVRRKWLCRDMCSLLWNEYVGNVYEKGVRRKL